MAKDNKTGSGSTGSLAPPGRFLRPRSKVKDHTKIILRLSTTVLAEHVVISSPPSSYYDTLEFSTQVKPKVNLGLIILPIGRAGSARTRKPPRKGIRQSRRLLKQQNKCKTKTSYHYHGTIFFLAQSNKSGLTNKLCNIETVSKGMEQIHKSDPVEKLRNSDFIMHKESSEEMFLACLDLTRKTTRVTID